MQSLASARTEACERRIAIARPLWTSINKASRGVSPGSVMSRVTAKRRLLRHSVFWVQIFVQAGLSSDEEVDEAGLHASNSV